MKKGLWAFFLCVPFFVLDWWLKYTFQSRACSDRAVDICGVLNEGFVFSWPFSWWGWGVAMVVFFLLLAVYLRSLPRPWSVTVWCSLGLLVAGGMSNTLDRLLYGGVRDYIALFTGVINLADMFVLIGVLLLVTRGLVPMKSVST